MSYLADRIIILFLSLYLFFVEGIAASYTSRGNADVITVLGMVVITCILCYVDSRRQKEIITLIYGMAALFVPSLAALSPVILYDISDLKLMLQGILIVVSVIMAHDLRIICMVLMLGAFAYLLNYRSAKSEWLTKQVKTIRDNSYEKHLILLEKNKYLMDKQDYEIYAATLKERNRIAREIHDNVGHMLTRSILQIGALMTINRDEPVHGQLAQVKDNLDAAMNNVRESVHDLHDEAIDLKYAVSDAISALEGKFRYELEYDMSDHVDRKYKYAMISIIKECVSNIIKHSENEQVNIILREHPAMYQIIVHDYSENEAAKPSAADYIQAGNVPMGDGIGLQNIRDRIDTLNGNMTITTGNGFRVFITFPKKNIIEKIDDKGE
ncbi:MAG: histidine kinase [Clostridium sp.]|nr:histidine kinase [Clostridium sp.]MCM1399957.1 histidine kinase [Clostridium sp.]MCM1460302.1 histidine kinase [Bacteroides sp.]